MYWKFLLPKSPKVVWRGLSLPATIVRDMPEMKKMDRSALLVLIPMFAIIVPALVAVLLSAEWNGFDYQGFQGFHWPESFDVLQFLWMVACFYWAGSVLSTFMLAAREKLIELSATLIKAGENPNATLQKKRNSREAAN